MGRPAERAGGRCRIESMRERRASHNSFVHRFASGIARRFATPIEHDRDLRVSVFLWPNLSASSACSVSSSMRYFFFTAGFAGSAGFAAAGFVVVARLLYTDSTNISGVHAALLPYSPS